MKVRVNGRELEIAPGMTVRHALLAAGLPPSSLDGATPRDRWGNRIGLDGALRDGDCIVSRDMPENV